MDTHTGTRGRGKGRGQAGAEHLFKTIDLRRIRRGGRMAVKIDNIARPIGDKG